MSPVWSLDDASHLANRTIRIRYSQAFWAEPTRPLLIFSGPDNEAERHVLPGATFGAALWLGYVPPRTSRIAIEWEGPPAAMRVDRLEVLGAARLFIELIRRGWPGLRTLVELPFSSRRSRVLMLRTRLQLEPLRSIERFAARRRRPFEADGLDAGVIDAPPLHVLISPGTPTELRDTRDSLARQTDGGWAEAHLSSGETLPDAEFILRVAAGERLAPEAVYALRARLAREPGLRLVYADCATINAAGRLVAPTLLPDWSPSYVRALGRLPGLVAHHRSVPVNDTAVTLETVLADEVGHIRRILLYRPASPIPSVTAVPTVGSSTLGSISIVMPTRNRLDLLRVAVRSVLDATTHRPFEFVIADNESDEPATLAYLAELAGTGQARVIRVPGDFNFSRIVNTAVATSSGDTIVLLNNDIEIVEPAWLGALLSTLQAATVGAVGARLLYPDGTLQHAGIVVGLGGYAGHYHRRLPGNARDHLGRLSMIHEVSAVTAACLAVRRSTFDEVGGFDEGLPVAFNDVDFCLRLRKRGLRVLWTPEATLLHHESASRGHDVGAKRARFLAEAEVFAQRWRPVIQDDPYFHPALSITRFREFLE